MTPIVERGVETPMRDGVVLVSDVYRPRAGGDFPVLLTRTPYGRDAVFETLTGDPAEFAEAGYIVVAQDVRGQGASGGEFYPLRDEGRDGYDTVEWAARLPGSTGRVGMFGMSYLAACCWLAAVEAPPSLGAIVPAMSFSSPRSPIYQDGAFNYGTATAWVLGQLAARAVGKIDPVLGADLLDRAAELEERWRWHLPLNTFPPLRPEDPRVAPYYFDWIAHPDAADPYWETMRIAGRHHDVRVPALNIEGWWDIMLTGGIENFTGLRASGATRTARQDSRLVVFPWTHFGWGPSVGDVEFGPDAVNTVPRMTLEFFDHHLKGERIEATPPVRAFMSGANRWRHWESWPPPAEPLDLFLMSPNCLGPEPAAQAAADRYTYDPADPAPTRGGHSLMGQDYVQGPVEQSAVEDRADVLVYTGQPLAKPLAVTGPITVTLFAATTAPDTDFTAKVVDVRPDGRAFIVTDGIVRLRYRDGEQRPAAPAEPGTVHRLSINVWPTSHCFAAGHRVRLEVSSSNFPQHDRNPNTGDPFGAATTTVPADQTVFSGGACPSRLTLPVVSD
ncbi:CocE/NonD family hydrolase [Kutzneria sp. NPDC052558]|uniref:CocE/NonD family hydrolase n=1 Tax=Kutzneria sp. NPDC052558 TaxID=3364121 RepID=UPI0037C95374